MIDIKELKDEELDKVSGGCDECMQEVYVYADKLFREAGTIAYLEKAMELVKEKIEDYNTMQGKIMNIERPILESQIQALYNAFVASINE